MAFQTIGLSTHIWNNNIRSALLLAAYPFILLAMVWGIAAIIGYGAAEYSYTGKGWPVAAGTANNIIMEWWPAITAVAAIWFIISYFFNTRMVRMLSHSRPVTRTEEPELYNLLENLCIARGVPMPRLEIIETRARNAFASGIDRKSFTITVTRGLLHCLQEDELEAVLAHELSHIINRDVRLLVVSIVFTGMIGFAAQIAWNSIRFGMYTSRGRRDGRSLMVLLVIVAVLWLGYIATIFTRFALSRRREYLADAGSVETTKNPEAMMRALLRISGRDKIPEATDDIALMCIENTKPFMGLFMTHPPIEKRIKAISEATGTPVPDITPGKRADDKARFTNPDDKQTEWLTIGRKGRKNPWV